MWKSPVPCPREGCAVTRWKVACNPLTQRLEQHRLAVVRDAAQLLSSATKHSSSVCVSDGPFYSWTGSNAVILSNLPFWFAYQKKYINHMIYLEQWWGFYRACAATRFVTLKGKLYKTSVRSRTNILLLASSPTTICPTFLIWNKCCRFPGRRLPIVCLERLMMDDMGVRHRRTIRRQMRMRLQIVFRKHGHKL